MRLTALIAAGALALTMTSAAEAGNGNGNNKFKGNAASVAQGCPPGLAKKSPSCVPPGLARKGRHYDRGERILDGYAYVRDYDRYGLARDNTYVRVGDFLYRVNPETREVLDVIGAVARLLD